MHNRSEEMIMYYWKGTSPRVSICCLAYNHEKFIIDALDSFLMQETDFPFEILIHDDASTDKTGEIIHAYEDKFPNIIKPIYQKVNQYAQGNSPISFVFKKAKGNYIATCEGDDYWKDPLKLQKQYDFMENNPDFSVCYHDSIVIDQHGNEISSSKLKNTHKTDATSFELKTSHKITTQTIFFINKVSELPREFFICFGGDKFLCSFLGGYGMGKYLENINKSVFRVHAGGINQGVTDTRRKYKNLLNTRMALFEYYNRIDDVECQNYFLKEIHLLSLRVLLLSFSNTEVILYVLKTLRILLLRGRSAQINLE